jgi:hypothetical protein
MQLDSRLLAALTACLTFSEVGAQTTLVAHYRLDEATGTVCNDSSGLGNHGVYVGGVSLGSPGARPGSATSVDFDGASGRVEIPGSASLDALRDDLSVAAWIEADVIQLQRVFANRRPNGSGSGGSWAYGMIPTGLRFTTLGVQDYNQNVALTPTTWYHFAVTFDANFQATFYLDGVAIGIVGGAQPSNAPGSANQYLIGVLDLGVGPAEWFDGRIDDLQVYSGTLSPADVQFLFANPGAPLGGGMLGTSYCSPAVVNSSGQSATTRASGSASVAANNLTLTAARLPFNSFGFFLTSRTQGFTQNPGGSSGHLCLGGAIGRYVGPGQIKNSGLAGSFDLSPNLTQTPSPTGFVQVLAGQTWNFQSWYRDAVGGVPTSNFTDGLSLLFL